MALYDLSEVCDLVLWFLWPTHRLIETENLLQLVR